MLRVLIADDEPAARAKLERLLAAHPDVTVVGTVSTGREAVDGIQTHGPDLVLLDIRMPHVDGFGVVEALATPGLRLPHVVFVTAFDEYAVQAFEVRALDYILKPFDGERLGAMLDRARHLIGLELRPTPEALQSLVTKIGDDEEALPAMEPGRKYVDRLRVRSAGRSLFISTRDVEWVEAVGNYVRVHAGRERPMVRQTLRAFQAQLDPGQFCRIHRSALVNVGHIAEIRPATSGDGILRLRSGMRLRLSRTYRGELERSLARR